MTKIKICGVQNINDAHIINQTQPDMAGIIFAKGRHQVDLKIAVKLRKEINLNIPIVGVFINASVNFIYSLYKNNIIQIAQLHGGQSETFIQQLKKHHIPTIKVFKPKKEKVIPTIANYTMLDSGNGSGIPLNWKKLNPINNRNLFIAGGLNPNNCLKAIKLLHPYAIDVTSGIEKNSKKDSNLVKRMIEISHKN